MDLYTASHRLDRRFVLDGSPLEIGHHAIVGDGYSCALIGVDGSIGWMCLPSFDSPSVFASILDTQKGGTCRVAPAAAGSESRQAYDDGTNVLQTLFHQPGKGTAVLTDYMPWTAEQHSSVHELHRMIEVRDGTVDLCIDFDPRFDYARGKTHVEATPHGALSRGPNGEVLSISISPGIHFRPSDHGGVQARFSLRAGHRVWVILSWDSDRPEPTATYRPFDYLRRTRRHWRRWASQLQYDGPWRHDVLRSALTLKLLQYAPTGAMVAAPTSSLPVSPDGKRNWDYRFSWTRDSAMAIRAMNLIGYGAEALDFFHFVRDCVHRRDRLDLMVSIHGGDSAEEQVLGHLAGHRGTGNVRIGNAATHQVQLDITGPLLDATDLYERSGGIISLRFWREIRRLVDETADTIGDPDHGIWEPRSEPQHHVHSKLMAWVALDRALQLAPLFGGDEHQERWRAAREEVRQDILERGFNSKLGSFVNAYGSKDVDAALLLFPIYGFLPPNHSCVTGTLDRVIRDLSDGRYLRRYRGDDGIGADEGGFLLCGFWLAEALALAGRVDEALEVMSQHVGAANHVGLLAEEVDPVTGTELGNFPQAFSHLGLIQAATRIDLAIRMRDEGSERAPRHTFDLPVRGS